MKPRHILLLLLLTLACQGPRTLEEGSWDPQVREGLEIAAACQKQLETARNDIKVYTEKGLEPFREEDSMRETPSSEDDGDIF